MSIVIDEVNEQVANARARVQELLATDPDFADEVRVALTGPVSVDDELLSRARSGEFGEGVFVEKYGKDFATELKSRHGV
jgi:hypothetical protein